MNRLACRVVATLAAIAVCNLAAGCGRRWPTVLPTTDEDFEAGTMRVLTVDVLPIDVSLATREKYKLAREQIVPSFDQASRVAIAATLEKRNYVPGAFIDWDGRYRTLQHGRMAAMNQRDLWATTQSLSSYGAAHVNLDSSTLLAPHLPARLGTTTSSDATLYVGGFGYVGKEKRVNVGKVVLVVVVVVVAVLVVAAALGGKGGKIGKFGKAAGNAAKAAGRTAHAVGKVAVRGLGRATLHAMDHGHDLERTLDVLGRANTHVTVKSDRNRNRRRVRQSGPSRMYIEMTLIDNRTGRTLWHTRQTFRANPARPKDVRKVMRLMLKTLPTAG